MDGQKLTRRGFLKGSAAGVFAATAPLGALAAAPVPAPAKWDQEAEVVVVGYGGAGAVTAMAAHDAGAKVLMLEKQAPDKHYPNTGMCGGLCHQATDAEEAAKYFKAVAFGVDLPKGIGDPAHVYPHYPEEFVEELAEAWGQGVVKTLDYVKALGDIEVTESMPGPAFPSFPGADAYGTFSAAGRGMAMFELFKEGVEEREIEVLWETPGKRLVMNDDGEVLGVVAEQEGKELYIKASKAVVITTGGFEYDEELKDAFMPGWGWAYMGNPGNTGDGLRMVMGAGAALGHMFHNAARVVAGGAVVEEVGTGIRCLFDNKGQILVDNFGRRYINEQFGGKDPERYQFYNQVIVYDISRLQYSRIPSWTIFDEDVRLLGPLASTFFGAPAVGLYEWSDDNSKEIEKGWILKADTIEELAAEIAAHPDNDGRMDAALLAETVAKFNEYAAEGEDLEFGRNPATLGPLAKPPFYAMPMYPGGPNSEGGPIKNAKAQVINVHGEPIPRLYCVGELGSVFSFAYQGGGNIAELIIFGQIAGQNAAAEKPVAVAA